MPHHQPKDVRVVDDEVLRPIGPRGLFFSETEFALSIGNHMVLIKVQYDAYNRQFKILDRELARSLEDGETYMVIADVSVKDLELKQSVEITSALVPVGP